MKSFIKRAAARIAPETTTALLSARARRHSHQLIDQWGLSRLNRTIIDAIGATVHGGPFGGMRLSPMSWKEHVGPYLLGTYEAELHPWFERILSRSFTSAVDIGAKFGYYAVGLAQKYPRIRVVAFDTDPWARRATREMASANGVADRIEVLGYCTPARLASVLTDRAFIISDCEGYERVLFGNGAPGALRTSTILVEIHEELSPGVEAAIRASFGPSHIIERRSSIEAPPRTAPPGLDFLSSGEISQAMHEVRPPQAWLLLGPREG